ncbi:MAG: RNA polymerase sigma factor [Verrucomicrobiota bacterium]
MSLSQSTSPVAGSTLASGTGPQSPAGGAPNESARWFTDEVHPHGGHLKSYLRGSFPSIRDVDDVVQESYLRIWRTKATQPIRSAKALLFKIARHLAIDLIRHHRRSPIDAVSDLSQLGVIEEGLTAFETVGLQEKIEMLTDALASLPARRRDIVVLRKLQRLSQAEVAARLGISERTVENQLYRGIRQCEAYLHQRGLKTLHGHETR